MCAVRQLAKIPIWCVFNLYGSIAAQHDMYTYHDVAMACIAL